MSGKTVIGVMPMEQKWCGQEIFNIFNLRQLYNKGWEVDEPELVD